MNNIIVCILIIISILLVYYVKINYKKENFKNTILNEENKKYITKDKFNEHITNLLKNLKTKFNNKIIEINTITEANILDKLPKGTILSWNNDNLPSDNWKWCDGSEDMIPDFNEKFPLGGKKQNSDDIEKYNKTDGKIKPEHLLFIDKNNNNKIKEEFLPQHTHKFTNFPSLKHEHTTNYISHTHKGYFYINTNDNFKTMTVYEGDHKPYGANFFGLKKTSDNSTSKGSHTHDVKMHTYPEKVDGKSIEKNSSGNPNIEDTGKPFYPRSKYINFIIKVV